MKVSLFCYLQDNQDGSASPYFFNTEQEAQTYAETADQRLCDDIMPVEFELDENGKLIEIPVREDY